MKIQVEKWTADDEVSYHIVDIQKCCDKILHNNSICLNYEYNKDDDYDNAIYSIKLAEINYIEVDYPNYAYQTINYCPFCGEEIKIEVVNTINKNKEYQTLKQQRYVLWDKCRRTDSKKEAVKLRAEVEVIDKQINNILNSETFEQYIKEDEKVDK